METTYTIRTAMPMPIIGLAQRTSALLSAYGDKAITAYINTDKTKQWLDDVAALVRHKTVLFGAIVDGFVVISLSDEEVAKAFEDKWGEKAAKDGEA